jgi:hypothetical protein
MQSGYINVKNLHSLTKKLQYLFMLERKNFYWKHFDRRLKNRKTYDISDIINVIENRKTNG